MNILACCYVNSVSIIIPTLNEEETIGKVIDEIPRENVERRGYRVEILVVDNNSTDKTREIAAGKGAKVIVEPSRGKGRAIRAAFGVASAVKFSWWRRGRLSFLRDGLKIGWTLIIKKRFDKGRTANTSLLLLPAIALL